MCCLSVSGLKASFLLLLLLFAGLSITRFVRLSVCCLLVFGLRAYLSVYMFRNISVFQFALIVWIEGLVVWWSVIWSARLSTFLSEPEGTECLFNIYSLSHGFCLSATEMEINA